MGISVKRKMTIAALALIVAGCANGDIPPAKSTAGRDPTLAEVPNKDETVRGADDPPIVTLDLSSSLQERRLKITDELPGNIIIPTTNLSGVPVTAALQAVLSGTDVSLSWNTGAFGSKLVTVMNLSGPLPQVIDKICSAAKVFCDYRHGSLELSDKETFVVNLPPVVRAISGTSVASSSSSSSSSPTPTPTPSSGAGNSMVDAINQLLGNESKAQIDDQGGNIIYTASVEGEERVSQYLMQLRTGRPLIVLQMYIWEVTLSSENAQGINWTSLSNTSITKGLQLNSPDSVDTLVGTAGSVSLGAVTSGIISANAMISFLATKGRVQTISNPQVTFVSGTSAQLKVGGTTRYISQVGTLTSTSNVSGTTNANTNNGNAGTNTVSTDSIDTGLNISVAGNYENGVVFANMEVSLRNLVSLNPVNSGSGTIDLPQTTDEKMDTVLRVRPGDSLVLAGLVTSADTATGQGLPVGDNALPLYGDVQANNHELVMIVRPSIVLFSDKPATEEAKKKETSKPLPDAVVIDKDGPRLLTLPPEKPVAAMSTPEMMTKSTQDIPIAPGDDSAPVDKQLMQRGFSHAFDQMLQPADGGAAEGGGS